MTQYGENIKICIEILSEENQNLTSEFSCGNPSIDHYFKNEAVLDKTSVTYLYIDKTNNKLIACITLACSAIFVEEPEIEQFSTLLSAMEVKYLATDESYQHIPYSAEMKNKSLSDMMFDHMLYEMRRMSHEKIGAAKIVLYAVPRAISFYKRHGFKEFGDSMYGDEGYYLDGCKPMYFDLN